MGIPGILPGIYHPPFLKGWHRGTAASWATSKAETVGNWQKSDSSLLLGLVQVYGAPPWGFGCEGFLSHSGLQKGFGVHQGDIILLKQWKFALYGGKTYLCIFQIARLPINAHLCSLTSLQEGPEQDLCVMFLFPQERNNSKLPIEMYHFFLLKELPPISNHHLYSIIWTFDFGVPPPGPLGISVAKPQTQLQVVSLSISIASCATMAIKVRSERKRVAEEKVCRRNICSKHRKCWGSRVKCWH